MLKDFLQKLYGDIDSGFFYLWTKQNSKTIWVEIKKGWIDEVCTLSSNLSGTVDLYFGISVQKNRKDGRGTTDNTLRIPGLWAEVDINSSVHASDKLCPDLNSALNLIKLLPFAPTYVINSGYGIHVYWKIDGGLPPEEGAWAVEEWQALLREKAKVHDWKIDPTADLARVYRIPFSVNLKNPEAPRKVEIIEDLGFTYKWENIKEGLTKKKTKKVKKEPDDLPQVDRIVEKCGWIKHCRDDSASLSEPEWFAMISIINRCKDGGQHIHDWSMSYEGYRKEETDRKIIRAMSSGGPMSCQKIKDDYNGDSYCNKCPYWDKIPGPIVLGKDKTAQFIGRYVYIQELEKFYDTEDRKFYSTSQLRNNQAHIVKGLDKILLSDDTLTKVTSVTYLPNGDQFVWEEGVRKLNTWKAHDVIPVPGDVTVFLDHFKRLMPDDEIRKYFLQYLAYNVQHQGKTTTWTPLIIGEPGAGKSWILRLMQRILGPNCQRISLDTMFGRFTDWQQGVSLLFVEEVKITSERQAHTERLNDMITMDTCRIDDKNMKAYNIPKRFNFIMFSNHDDAIPVGTNDRRFMIYKSPAPPLTKEEGEILHTELDRSAAFHNYLLNLDLSDFKPNASAPTTDMKIEMMMASEVPWQQIIRLGIEQHEGPFCIPLVRTEKLTDFLKEKTGRYVSPVKIGIFLKRLGHCCIGMRRVQGSLQFKIWAVRNYDEMRELPEAAVKKMFDNMSFENIQETDDEVQKVLQMKPTGG